MDNLNQFFSEFRNEFQPVSRYQAYVFPPNKLLTAMLTSGPTLGGGILSDIASFGEAAETKTSMPAVAQWLARGVLCQATRLPSRSFEAASLNMYGYTENVPYHTEYTPLSCTFLMPLILGDNALPRFVNYWQNFIQNGQHGPDDGYDFRFPKDYYGSLLLALFDKKNQPTLVYKFENVYPLTSDSSELGWEQNNTFLSYNVSFQFSYWKMLSRLDPEVLALLGAQLIAGQ